MIRKMDSSVSVGSEQKVNGIVFTLHFLSVNPVSHGDSCKNRLLNSQKISRMVFLYLK